MHDGVWRPLAPPAIPSSQSDRDGLLLGPPDRVRVNVDAFPEAVSEAGKAATPWLLSRLPPSTAGHCSPKIPTRTGLRRGERVCAPASSPS